MEPGLERATIAFPLRIMGLLYTTRRPVKNGYVSIFNYLRTHRATYDRYYPPVNAT